MRTRTVIRSLVASLVTTGALLAGSAALAAVPATVTHQGRLYDAASKPVTATLDVQFAVYDTANASVALWTEVHSIDFEDGYFAVRLGEAAPFDSAVFDGSVRYLGITVGSDPRCPRAPTSGACLMRCSRTT